MRAIEGSEAAGYFEGIAEVAVHVADVLAADNPRFDRARFLEACETGTCKGMPGKAPSGRASAEAEAVLPLARLDPVGALTELAGLIGADLAALPPCVRIMRCLCAGHAGGLAVDAACDTAERHDPAKVRCR